jgi:GT2 family glycosyltransferase/spore maturation protein CgeB
MESQRPPTGSESWQLHLEESLRAARRELEERQGRISALEAELARERRRFRALARRRSVRAALGLARLAKPLLALIRRDRDSASDAAVRRTRADVVATIRAVRPGRGAAHGPPVTLVILTRDGARHLERLLVGLRDTTAYRSFDAVIVDNGSTDDTATLLGRDWGFPITVIRHPANLSFSAGCNEGIAAASGEFILLLNNDVEPINAGWLGAMVAALEEDDTRAAAGALLVYPERPAYSSPDPNVGADLTVQHRGIGFSWRRRAEPAMTVPWAYNLGVGEDPTESTLAATTSVPAATAACLLVRTEVLRAIGGLDEGFIYGMEDVDLCLRIRNAGHEIVIAGGAALFHHEFATQSQLPPRGKQASGLGNVQLFAEKWAGYLSRRLLHEALDPGPSPLRSGAGGVIAITVTRDDPAAGWGDWYTAHELGDALERDGRQVRYAERYEDRWYDLPDDVTVVISLIDGYDVRRAPRDALTVAWVRNWTDRWTAQPWFPYFDVYIPSSATSRDVLTAAGATVTDVLPLATNPARFYPRPVNAVYASDYATTCNYWKAVRPGIEEIRVMPGERFAIFGKGWDQVPRLARYNRGALPYEELAEVYSSAKIIIDETATPTLPYGAVNSRVFDATACGALVISNNVAGSAELFEGALPTYRDAAEQRALLDRFLDDDRLRTETASALRDTVLKHHTYQHRAAEIVAAAHRSIELPRVALKIGPPDRETAALWGDTHFADAFGRALRRHGLRTAVHILPEWDLPANQSVDIAVHIRGLGTYVPKEGHYNVLWIISHPEDVTPKECDGYDLVLVASKTFAESLQERVSVPVAVMYQATDRARFSPVGPDPDLATEVLFVGNSRGRRRMAVDAALEVGAQLTVYGSGWDGIIPSSVVAGEHFPNERLASLYASAQVVINDHWPDMARQGFISNRIFDVLASGGVVFTDPVEGLDELFNGLIPVFSSPEELRQLLEDRQRRPDECAARMAEAREIVLTNHTFEQRAARFAALVDRPG